MELYFILFPSKKLFFYLHFFIYGHNFLNPIHIMFFFLEFQISKCIIKGVQDMEVKFDMPLDIK